MPQVKILKRPKMSETMKGKQVRLGIKMSEEAKKARRDKMLTASFLRKRIPVIDIATKTSYSSILHAATALGISTASIYRSINNKVGYGRPGQFIRLEDNCPVGF